MSTSGPNEYYQKPVKVNASSQQVEFTEITPTLGISVSAQEDEEMGALRFNLDDAEDSELHNPAFVLSRKKLFQILRRESWQIISPLLEAGVSGLALLYIIRTISSGYSSTYQAVMQASAKYPLPIVATISAIAKMLAQHKYQRFFVAQNLWKSSTDGVILAAFLSQFSFTIITRFSQTDPNQAVDISDLEAWSIISGCLLLGSFKSIHTYFKNDRLRQDLERMLQGQRTDYAQWVQNIHTQVNQKLRAHGKPSLSLSKFSIKNEAQARKFLAQLRTQVEKLFFAETNAVKKTQQLADHYLANLPEQENYQNNINRLITKFNVSLDANQPLELIQIPITGPAQVEAYVQDLLTQIKFRYKDSLQSIQEINEFLDMQLFHLEPTPDKILRVTTNIFYRFVNHAICRRTLTFLEGAAVSYTLLMGAETIFVKDTATQAAQIVRYTGSGIGGLIHTLMLGGHHPEENWYHTWYENTFEVIEATAFGLAAYYAFSHDQAKEFWGEEVIKEQTYFWAVALPLFIIFMQLFGYTRKIQQDARHQTIFKHSLRSCLHTLCNHGDEEMEDEEIDEDRPLLRNYLDSLPNSSDDDVPYALQLTSPPCEDDDIEIHPTYLPSRAGEKLLKSEDELSDSFSKLKLNRG